MTLAEAQLLQANHTSLGIDEARSYLLNDDGTPKLILMSNGTVSNPSTSAYIRPVAVVTVNNE